MDYWEYRPLLDILGTCPFLGPFCVPSADIPEGYIRGNGNFLGKPFKQGGFYEIKAAVDLPTADTGEPAQPDAEASAARDAEAGEEAAGGDDEGVRE